MESSLCEEKCTRLAIEFKMRKSKDWKYKSNWVLRTYNSVRRTPTETNYGKNLHKLSTFHESGNSMPVSSFRRKAPSQT
jgi:hypothetical protein